MSDVWLSTRTDATAFAAEVRGLLETRGALGPVGIDEISMRLLEAMSDAGIEVRDASPGLRRAGAINSAAEIDGFSAGVSLAQSAITAASESVRPGVHSHEFSAALTAAAINRGARDWLLRPPEPHVFTAGELVTARCCARWQDGYFVDVARMVACGDIDPAPRQLLHAGVRMLKDVLTRIKGGVSGSSIVSHVRSLVPHGCEVATDQPLLRVCDRGYAYPIAGWFGGDSAELWPGMVLSVGFQLTDAYGHMIHIRDQVAVTVSGYHQLTVT